MIEIRVYGDPKPGGSKNGFYNKKIKKVMMVDACKGNKSWRQDVASAAVELKVKDGFEASIKPLSVSFIFYKQRPKGHYDSKGNLRKAAPRYPTTKPDTTKLVRSAEDALTGIVWKDDSQIVAQYNLKKWADETEAPGAKIIVEEL